MSLTRTLATSLTLALVAIGALAPAAGADSTPTAEDRRVVVEEGALPVLTPEDAEAIRLHTSRALADRSAQAGGPDTGITTATVNPVVTRHSGDDRYSTAAALANTMWRDAIWADVDGAPFPYDKVVFVASGHDFPDALAGGALAAYYGGPTLLTRKDGLPGPTRQALAGLDPDYIVVLGGAGAVSDPVIWALADYVPHMQRVVRYGGDDRYQVSAGIARTIFDHGFGQRAYVALGTNWPDGLAGGAAAGWDKAPLLLTRQDSVPGVVLQTLAQGQPEEIVLLGGRNAVSDAVAEQLETVAPVVRVGGTDRFSVAANVARLHPTRYGATVASGQNWPDALAGSAYAGLVGDKLLLVRSSGLPAATRRMVVDEALALIDALGGLGPLPDEVLDELRSLEVPTPG